VGQRVRKRRQVKLIGILEEPPFRSRATGAATHGMGDAFASAMQKPEFSLVRDFVFATPRLHHHGEDAKALLRSARQRHATA
jgi:hypothetical protein